MKADDILKSNLCILPWVSVEATPVGSYRPCCLALDEITDELGNVLKVSESTISDAVNSESMNRLRREFAQNNRPETCNRCWAEEDANRTSKRINTLNKFKHEIEMINFEADEIRDIWFLDLKLGNICNLKCRICGSWSSSKWAQEELSTVAYKNKKDNFSYKMLKAGNWPRESQNFWNNVIDVLPDVKYIEFTGGEPFLIEEHFNILRYAAEHGYAKNISVHYNTNATVYPEDILKTIWPEFKEIEIAFSVDNVESRFEYERYGATWAKSCENISKINEAKKVYPNIKTQLCFTINFFNCANIPELLEWAETQSFDYIHWNMLHDPSIFNVSKQIDPVKEYFISVLASANIAEKYRAEVESLQQFIRNGKPMQSTQELLERIDMSDKYRNQSFKDLYPELYSALTK